MAGLSPLQGPTAGQRQCGQWGREAKGLQGEK